MPGRFSGGGSSSRRRYPIWSGRTTNLAASQTNLALTSSTAQSHPAPVAGRICGWAFASNALGLSTTPVAGSALTVSVVRTSAAGTADAAAIVGTVAIGVVNQGFTVVTNEITLAAGDCVHVALTTDGSWTATALDPWVQLWFEET